jgi:hypothetical protein
MRLEDMMGYLNHQAYKRRVSIFDSGIVSTIALQTEPLINGAASNDEDEALRAKLFVEVIYPTYLTVQRRHPNGQWESRDADAEWSKITNWMDLLGKKYLPQKEE